MLSIFKRFIFFIIIGIYDRKRSLQSFPFFGSWHACKMADQLIGYTLRAPRISTSLFIQSAILRPACLLHGVPDSNDSTVHLLGTCDGPLQDRGYGSDVLGAESTSMLQQSSFGKP